MECPIHGKPVNKEIIFSKATEQRIERNYFGRSCWFQAQSLSSTNDFSLFKFGLPRAVDEVEVGLGRLLLHIFPHQVCPLIPHGYAVQR